MQKVQATARTQYLYLVGAWPNEASKSTKPSLGFVVELRNELVGSAVHMALVILSASTQT